MSSGLTQSSSSGKAQNPQNVKDFGKKKGREERVVPCAHLPQGCAENQGELCHLQRPILMALPDLACAHSGLMEAHSHRTIDSGLLLWALCQADSGIHPVEAGVHRTKDKTGAVCQWQEGVGENYTLPVHMDTGMTCVGVHRRIPMQHGRVSE
jgi:hypothetical protein